MKPPYIHTESVHNFNAAQVVVPIILNLVDTKSVLDVGCGIGTWLKIFGDQGIQDCLGIDGDYVDRSLLKIPSAQFKSADLSLPFELNRKFDLVISLEVAEHLPESSADAFVESLTRHAHAIVFSAAIPGQGGQNHINEQWPEYWQRKFAKHGFYFHDRIRPLIWNNDQVDWWYRQNIFLVLKEQPSSQIEVKVHPECFRIQSKVLKQISESLATGRIGVRQSLKVLMKSLALFLKR